MPSYRTLALSLGASKRPGRKIPRSAALAVIAGLAVLLLPTATLAATPVGLGTADSFAVLAGSGITNTGPTTITGDVGTSPLPAETGFGSVTLNGTNHQADAVALQAQTDLTTAYNTAAASGPPTAVPIDLGGLTLTPGVYNATTLAITGTLTLDTLGDPAAVFIFQSASTLVTASNSSVIVLDGGTACNVFWQVGSSATLGTNSGLIGSVLALTSITATTGATVEGRLLARNGAVTMDTNTITAETCAASTTTTTPGSTTTTTPGSTTTTTPGTTTTTTPGTTTTTTPGSTTTTTSSTTTTVAPGSTTTIAGAGPTTSIAEAAPTPTTNGLDTTGAATGPTTTTSTPDTVPPGLARTGFENRLTLLGCLTIAFGVLIASVSRARRVQSSR